MLEGILEKIGIDLKETALTPKELSKDATFPGGVKTPRIEILIDKIKNGDYDDSPYRWQIYYCDWEIDEKRKQFPDSREWAYETRLDRQRRRRLREDHEKYEKDNLKQLQKDFLNTFRMDRDDYQRDVVEVGGTLEEFYHYCEMRYGKFNKPTTAPRRGRPPKIR